MTISPDKFDIDLACNLEPFGYMENSRTVETKNSGTMMVVAVGAMNYLGHYSPEFGGVAVVHLNPDLLIAVKYIPWDAKARRKELMEQYMYLKNNHESMSSSDLTHYFYLDCLYVLPAKKQRLREEYYDQIAKENKLRAQIMKEAMENEKIMQKISFGNRTATTLNRKKITISKESEEEVVKDPPAAKIEEQVNEEPVDEYKGEKLIPIKPEEKEES